MSTNDAYRSTWRRTQAHGSHCFEQSAMSGAIGEVKMLTSTEFRKVPLSESGAWPSLSKTIEQIFSASISHLISVLSRCTMIYCMFESFN